jgi:hypothetical protein
MNSGNIDITPNIKHIYQIGMWENSVIFDQKNTSYRISRAVKTRETVNKFGHGSTYANIPYRNFVDSKEIEIFFDINYLTCNFDISSKDRLLKIFYTNGILPIIFKQYDLKEGDQAGKWRFFYNYVTIQSGVDDEYPIERGSDNEQNHTHSVVFDLVYPFFYEITDSIQVLDHTVLDENTLIHTWENPTDTWENSGDTFWETIAEDYIKEFADLSYDEQCKFVKCCDENLFAFIFTDYFLQKDNMKCPFDSDGVDITAGDLVCSLSDDFDIDLNQTEGSRYVIGCLDSDPNPVFEKGDSIIINTPDSSLELTWLSDNPSSSKVYFNSEGQLWDGITCGMYSPLDHFTSSTANDSCELISFPAKCGGFNATRLTSTQITSITINSNLTNDTKLNIKNLKTFN